MNGIVKNLKPTFGFISASNNGEYFFHKQDFSGHWDDLVVDFNNKDFGKIKVTFEVEESPKGPRASNVRRTDFPNQ